MKNRVVFLIILGFFLANRLNAQVDKLIPLDPLLQNYSYPFPVKFIQLFVQKASYRMAYMDLQPDRPNGKTVLLLHGKNFSGAYWKQTAEALQKAGFRVVIPDQLGFGKSSKPANIQYSFQMLALNTKALLDSLHITKTSIVAHSMGGMLGTRFTLMFAQIVDKLILENPIGLEDWKLKVPYQAVDAWYKNELSQDYDKIKKYQQENYFHGQWKPEYEEGVRMLAGWSIHPDYPMVAWNSALTYDMIFTQPVVYEFEQIKTPTLLIIGQLDKTALGKQLVPEEVRSEMGNYPKLGRDTRERIKGSRLTELDNVGHIPHIEAFEQFISPVLDFLLN